MDISTPWSRTETFLLLFYRLEGLPYKTIRCIFNHKLGRIDSTVSLRCHVNNLRRIYELEDMELGRELDRGKTERFMRSLILLDGEGVNDSLLVVGRGLDEEELRIKDTVLAGHARGEI